MNSHLQSLHEAMDERLLGLARALEPKHPAIEAVAHARWRLSCAVRDRRDLIQKTMMPHLKARMTPAEARRLDALADRDVVVMKGLSDHIATWTTANVLSDWPGYRAASHLMRETMRQQVEAERLTIFPLLERYPPPEQSVEPLFSPTSTVRTVEGSSTVRRVDHHLRF